jgi:hypothetical protein
MNQTKEQVGYGAAEVAAGGGRTSHRWNWSYAGQQAK